MKFFFHISKKEQQKRLDALRENKNTSWRVSEEDLWQNKHYNIFLDVFDRYLTDTNRSNAPWYIIDAKDHKWAELQVMQFLNQGIETALRNSASPCPILQNTFRMKKMPLLADIPLDKEISEDEYRSELKKLQKELSRPSQ